MKVCKARYGSMAYLENDVGIGRNIQVYGEWSQLEMDFLLTLINENDIVLDVGANIGSHTLPFAKKVGPNGRVYAFEPQNKISQMLSVTLAMNDILNTFVISLPAGNIPGDVVQIPQFNYQEVFNFGGASIKDNFYSSYYHLPTICIDDLNLPKCQLIKADVEGFEYEVISGAEHTIYKFKPFLYLENNRQEQLIDIQKFLSKFNYAIFAHMPPTFNPNNFNGVKENPWHGDYLEPNMICLPIEKIDMLENVPWLGARIL